MENISRFYELSPEILQKSHTKAIFLNNLFILFHQPWYLFWILLCAFCACPQGVYSRWWMEMFLNFATMCFFICLLKELGPEHAKSHWLHLLYFSPVCILKVSSNRLSKKRQSHIGCISFLQCVLSNVSSSWLPEKRQIHIGCIYLAFHQCAFSNVSSNRLPKERHCHIALWVKQWK